MMRDPKPAPPEAIGCIAAPRRPCSDLGVLRGPRGIAGVFPARGAGPRVRTGTRGPA